MKGSRGGGALPKASIALHSPSSFKTFRSSKVYLTTNDRTSSSYATSVNIEVHHQLGLQQFDDTLISELASSLKHVCGSCHTKLERFLEYTCRRAGDDAGYSGMSCHCPPPRLLSLRFVSTGGRYDDHRGPSIHARIAYCRRNKLQMLRTLVVKAVFQYAVNSSAKLRRALVDSPSRFVALTVSDDPSVDGLYEEGLQRRLCRLEGADRLSRSTLDGEGALYALRRAHEKEGALMTNVECSVSALRGDLECLRYARERRAVASRDVPLDKRTCVYAAASVCSSYIDKRTDHDAAACVEYVYRYGGCAWYPTAAIKAASWNLIDPMNHDHCRATVRRILAIEEERNGRPFVFLLPAWYGVAAAEDHFANVRTDAIKQQDEKRHLFGGGCSSTNALKRALGAMAAYTTPSGAARQRRRPPWTLSGHGKACCTLRETGLADVAFFLSKEDCSCCTEATLASSPVVAMKTLEMLLHTWCPVRLLFRYLKRVRWHPDTLHLTWSRAERASYSNVYAFFSLSRLLRIRFRIRVWHRGVRRRIQARACVTIQRAWTHFAYSPGGPMYQLVFERWKEALTECGGG